MADQLSDQAEVHVHGGSDDDIDEFDLLSPITGKGMHINKENFIQNQQECF